MNHKIIIIAHNLRSAHNVGSLLRTADGLGAEKIYLTGYTPFPYTSGDSRLPHLAAKIDRQIAKTALGAQNSVAWEHHENIIDLLARLKNNGYQIVALEQTEHSQPLSSYTPNNKIAIILGREVEGIEDAVLRAADTHVEIPMSGKKESFNVVIAAGIALYHCRYVKH